MKKYSFSHTIEKDNKSVLQIIYDLKNYNSWNNCLRFKSGQMEIGEKLILEASLDGKKFINWPCKVEQLNPNSFVLSKSIIARSYMHMKHHFEVIPIDANHCEVTHTWEGTGFAPYFFWNKIIPVLNKFKSYNESLIQHIKNQKTTM